MIEMTDDIQSELDRRNQETRENEDLISLTVQRVMSDWLKKNYGERLSAKERLSHTSSQRSIATDFLWRRWLQND